MSLCACSTVGQTYANAKAANRERLGTRVVITDRVTGDPLRTDPYPAILQKSDPRAGDFVPQAGRNVAFSDIRIYEVSPRDFPTPPDEGDGLSEQGQEFTIIAVPPALVKAAVPHTMLLVCYRTPATGEATVDTATNKRKTYQPPDSTV